MWWTISLSNKKLSAKIRAHKVLSRGKLVSTKVTFSCKNLVIWEHEYTHDAMDQKSPLQFLNCVHYGLVVKIFGSPVEIKKQIFVNPENHCEVDNHD